MGQGVEDRGEGQPPMVGPLYLAARYMQCGHPVVVSASTHARWLAAIHAPWQKLKATQP